MLQKIKRNLICSTIVLLSTNSWAFSPNPNIPPIGVSGTFRLAAGETRLLPKNIFYKELVLKCTAATQDTKCHYITVENNTDFSCKINEQETKGLIKLSICHQELYNITAELLSQLKVTNPKSQNPEEDSWVELNCAT